MRSIALFFASLAAAFVQAAAAQDVPTRVGRLAYTQGPVSVYQDPELGWDKAYVNTPITSENSVWTDRGARAELRAGGIAIRLGDETQLDVSRLDENELDAFVPRGSANLRIRYKESNDRITLSTPHAQFVIETDGRYRIDADEERNESRLTVFGGHAYMESASGRTPVEPGRTVIVSGSEFHFERARESGLDRWAATRDQQWQDSRARRYVSSDMTGYEELDRYGSWSEDPDYGTIWYPTRVSAGWAPYRYGHWSYLRPWGWTWIDDEPWGYAPSHYGRWLLIGSRWAWAPGRYVRERPVWAPALVGFIGGAGWSIGVSTGAPVGWYPLAPWERYEPWWRVSPTYVTRVNRYVVADRRPRWWQGRGDEWRHWNRDRATTVVNRDVFVNRRPVQTSVVRVNPEQIRRAPVASSPQAVQQMLPQRNELLRYREANRTNVAAPTVMRQAPAAAQPQMSAPAPQQQQQVGQVVRPEFRRRGAPPVVAPAPAAQPPMAAPTPQQAQPQLQPQNPAARVDRAQQRQAEEAARASAQQQERAQREAQRQQQEAAQRAAQEQRQQQQQAQDLQRRREEAAQRAAEDTRRREEAFRRQQQEQAQRAQQEQAQRAQQEQAQRAQQEQAQRAAQEQRQQQEAAQRAAEQQRRQQEAAQRAAEQQRRQQEAAQRAQQEQAQRAQQEQAQRAQREQAQRAQQEQAQRAQQEQAQRAAEQQRRQQEAAQRAQQEQAQRAAAEQQRRQQEAAQREAQRQQQEAQRAQQQQQQQQQAQERAQRGQPAPQANPAARGEDRGRGRGRDDRDDKDKDKEKEKDKDKR